MLATAKAWMTWNLHTNQTTPHPSIEMCRSEQFRPQPSDQRASYNNSHWNNVPSSTFVCKVIKCMQACTGPIYLQSLNFWINSWFWPKLSSMIWCQTLAEYTILSLQLSFFLVGMHTATCLSQLKLLDPCLLNLKNNQPKTWHEFHTFIHEDKYLWLKNSPLLVS